MRHRRCGTVLLVNEDPQCIDLTGDALRTQGVMVLLAPGLEDALGALRSGFHPDVILVDASRGPARLTESVLALLEEPAWREIPVLGVSDQTTSIVQVAPRRRRRSLPLPEDAEGMRELLERVCSERDDDRDDQPSA